MSFKAKPVLKDRFWIVEENGVRVGTLGISDDKFVLSSQSDVQFFNSKRHLEKTFGKDLFEKYIKEKKESVDENEVQGYKTATKPSNPMYDVKRRLPLFTKSEKSKSVYCAGYYIIRFDKGWVKSFCPKLITLERYDFQGPFKTDFEMKEALSRANR